MVDLLGKWEVGGVIYWNLCKYAWKHTEYEWNSNDLGSQYFVWPPFKARWMLPAFIYLFKWSHTVSILLLWKSHFCIFVVVFMCMFVSPPSTQVCFLQRVWVCHADSLQMVLHGGFKILWYFSLFIIPPILQTPPTPLAKMEPQTMMVAEPWFSNALNWQSFEL